MDPVASTAPVSAAIGQLIPKGTRINVFQEIYWVFLILGTLVGVVVIGYMLYNAYKYREGSEKAPDPDTGDWPTLGEMPRGGGGGKKLFLSFALSTIIVLSLIIWTYGTLLYVESNAAQTQPADKVEVTVTGYQFGWNYHYPNGATTSTLRVPKETVVELRVNSSDVFHNYGIPALRVKTDAIPGQYTTTWFMANETGTYTAKCYEICGEGHSYMTSDVVIMEEDAYEDWYAEKTAEQANQTTNETATETAGGGH